MNGETPAAPTRPLVLVVEDDGTSRRVLAALVRRYVGPSATAATAAEGLARLADGPEAVLLDLDLPDASGLTLLEHVRRHRLPVRVAVLTGVGEADRLAAARALEPDAVFVKPVRFEDVERWLKRA